MAGRRYGKKKNKPTGTSHGAASSSDHLQGPARFALREPNNSNELQTIISLSQMLGCDQPPARMPKSTWVLHSGDTHITNDRSLLVSARDCDEHLFGKFGNRMKALAIGDIYLELANNLTLHLQRVRYVPDVMYNLLSDIVLQNEMGFAIEFDKPKTHLCFKENSGGETRFEAINMVAGLFVFLTKNPTIEDVVEYAAAHPTPNQFVSLSTFSQDSTVGQHYRKLEQTKGNGSVEINLEKVESID